MAVAPLISDTYSPFFMTPLGSDDFDSRAMSRNSPTVGSADTYVPMYSVLMPDLTI